MTGSRVEILRGCRNADFRFRHVELEAFYMYERAARFRGQGKARMNRDRCLYTEVREQLFE